MTRKEIREREGIDLTYVVGSITAGSSIIVPLKGKFQRYKPFDNVFVDNTSSAKLKVYINQNEDNFLLVPTNVGKEKTTNRKIQTLEIENTSSANDVSSGEVILTLIRKPKDVDDLAKKLFKVI